MSADDGATTAVCADCEDDMVSTGVTIPQTLGPLALEALLTCLAALVPMLAMSSLM